VPLLQGERMKIDAEHIGKRIRQSWWGKDDWVLLIDVGYFELWIEDQTGKRYAIENRFWYWELHESDIEKVHPFHIV